MDDNENVIDEEEEAQIVKEEEIDSTFGGDDENEKESSEDESVELEDERSESSEQEDEDEPPKKKQKSRVKLLLEECLNGDEIIRKTIMVNKEVLDPLAPKIKQDTWKKVLDILPVEGLTERMINTFFHSKRDYVIEKYGILLDRIIQRYEEVKPSVPLYKYNITPLDLDQREEEWAEEQDQRAAIPPQEE